MMDVIIEVAFSLASTFVKILLAPIDVVIMNFLPDVKILIEHIGDFLTLCLSCAGWVIDLFGIPKGVVALIVSYFILKYTIYLTIYIIKLIISWAKSFFKGV